MAASLWGIFSVLTTTWLVPWVSAAPQLQLPLPQEIIVPRFISQQLLTQAFSTDPRQPSVAAAENARPQLETFITNNQACVRQDEDLSYRIVVRNKGDGPARNVTVQFQYPQTTSFRDSDPKPTKVELPDTRLIEWHENDVAPGATTTYSVILNVQQDVESVTVNVTVLYTDKNGKPAQTLTSHTIDDPCSESPAPAGPRPNKQPAIVCDPAEPQCASTYTTLKLGQNYQRVLQDPDHRAILGQRFAEAYADILPGECRVAADDIIVTPEFHDALNRRAKPAANYLRPLYNSGQDFRQFIVENEIYAFPHFQYVRDELYQTADANWNEHIDSVRDVLTGKKAASSARAEYDQQATQWKQRIQDLQQPFYNDYEQTQQRKKDDVAFAGGCNGRFGRLACQAIRNAQESTLIACGPPPSDGGLSGSLPQVYQEYDRSLNARLEAYPVTETESLVNYTRFIDERREKFAAVIGTYSDQNRGPLEAYAHNLSDASIAGIRALLDPYDRHKKDDAAADDDVRLRNWEVALDAPKTVATICEKENIFPPRVETTWCESGQEPELIIQEAPIPAKVRTIRPPQAIEGGANAVIREADILGTVCGGGPGDPYWTLTCKCHCGQLVPCGSGLVLCEDLFACTGDPLDRLLRHDVHVTSQLECFWDDGKHEDPHF